MLCGKKIHIKPSKFKTRKVCSQECHYKWNLKILPHGANWGGGKYYSRGYVKVFTPNHPNKDTRGYVTEHRLVMEKKLKRFLTKKEIVHHINGIKNDNRLENLVLYSSQSEHVKEHLKDGRRGFFKID